MNIKKECIQRMSILKIICHENHGAHRNSAINLYKSIILSKMDYGSVIFNSANKTNLKHLDTIQRSCLKIASGAFHTSPTNLILYDTNQLHLKYRRAIALLQFGIKRLCEPQNDWKFYLNNQSYLEQFKKKPRLPQPFIFQLHLLIDTFNIPIPQENNFNLNNTPPWKISKIPTNQSLLEYSKKNPILSLEKFENIKRHYTNYEHIYTDASKSTQNVGYAIITNEEIIQKKLPNFVSIYSAELLAIKNAFTYILNKNTPNNTVIFTDSQSSINALKNMSSKSTLIKEIQEIYHQTKNKNIQIVLCWIPSHIGILGNEIADKIAKRVANDDTITNHFIFNNDDLCKLIKTKITRYWLTTSTWKSTSSNEYYKSNKTNLLEKHNPDWSRNLSKVVTRLRIGHTKLTHKHILRRETHPICETCKVTLSVKHILCECKKFISIRNNLKLNPKLSIILNNEKIFDTLTYLKKINLLNKI